MAEERVVPTRPPVNGNGAPVTATTERTGEGDVYYTGPRPLATQQVEAVATVIRDRVRWQAIIGGAVATITTMAVLSMLGIAIGFMVFGPGSSAGTIGLAVGIWAACSAFLSLIAGGWVAGRTAGYFTLGSALINGFLVGATILVLILWATIAGVGDIFGLIGGSAGGIVHAGITNPDALRNALSNASSLANNTNVTVNQGQASGAAWYVFAAIVIGLIASTLGGWFGWLSRLPGETVVRR